MVKSKAKLSIQISMEINRISILYYKSGSALKISTDLVKGDPVDEMLMYNS